MVRAKLIEIRDSGTFIPALAVQMVGDTRTPADWLLRRAGYGRGILLVHLTSNRAELRAEEWGRATRTMIVAHLALEGRSAMGMLPDRVEECTFDNLVHGAVLDVEYLIGASDRPKVSEQTVEVRDD